MRKSKNFPLTGRGHIPLLLPTPCIAFGAECSLREQQGDPYSKIRKSASDKGLIRPILEYGAPLLYCSNQSLHNEILKIENRCLKIINFDQHKNTTRSIHNIFPIPQRLKYLYLLSFYKLIRGLVPCIDNSLLPVGLSSDTRLADGGGFRLAGSCHKFSLNYLGAKLFNELPSSIRTQSNLKSFKAHLRCLIFTQ
jgi:hypothetical protein